MTPPTDSLDAALTRVLLAELIIEQGRAEECASALAAAVREWVKGQMPPRWMELDHLPGWASGYNAALAEMTRRLGL